MSIGDLEAALSASPTGQGGQKDEVPDLATLREVVNAVEKGVTIQALATPAPLSQPETPPPAPVQPEWTQAILRQQEQLASVQAQMADLIRAVQTQAETHRAPAPSRHDELRVMAEEMRAARLDPTNEQHVLTYQLWRQNQALEATLSSRLQQIEEYQRSIHQRAEEMSLEQHVGKQVRANLASFKNIPEATLSEITRLAASYAQKVPEEQAITYALQGFMPLLKELEKHRQTPAPPPSATLPGPAVPAFENQTLQQIEARLRAMTAAATSGRGGGRNNGQPSIEQVEKALFRP